MSKITNDGLNRSGTGCFIAVLIFMFNSVNQWSTMSTNGRPTVSNKTCSVHESVMPALYRINGKLTKNTK